MHPAPEDAAKTENDGQILCCSVSVEVGMRSMNAAAASKLLGSIAATVP